MESIESLQASLLCLYSTNLVPKTPSAAFLLTRSLRPPKATEVLAASRRNMPAIRNRAGKARAIQRRFTPYLGSKIANIFIGSSTRLFTVHADLICKSSPYFRKKLQGNRQTIEGTCSICFDDLDSGAQLTYCTMCGGNFHEECADRWFKQSRGRLCPLCRGLWPKCCKINGFFRLKGIRQADFEAYREWLYSGQFTYDKAVQQDDFKPMIQVYLYSLYVGDMKFGTAILSAMLEWYQDKGTYPDQDAVALAYGTYTDLDTIARYYKEKAADNLPGLHRLQRFLVDTYMAVAHASWFEDEDWCEYPHEFLRDLVVAMFCKHPAKNNWNIDNWKAELEAEE